MSEPLPIAQSFLMNDMWGRVRLDSIICLVDAENLPDNLTSNTHTALEQIEFADYVIITKWYGIDPMILNSIEDIIRRVNAYAPILNMRIEDIPLDALLDTDRISLTDAENMTHISDEHTHSETMSHCVHRSDYVFDHILLSEFFRELPYETYRVKWWVRLATDPDKIFLIQKVGARFTVEEMIDPPKDQQNILVFIGESVNPFVLNIQLAKCRSRSL